LVAVSVKRASFVRFALDRSLNTFGWLPSAVRWALVSWIVVFWRLGYLSLLDPDEAHYAELTREMAHARNWLVPLLDGVPYIDKPVLFHWMQGLSVWLIGETEFATRLPSALAAIALFWTTRWLGKQLYGETVGEWGALMFATIPITFALASIGFFDMVFATLLFGAVACLFVAALRSRSRIQYVGYALLTLAVMTKGPIALLLVGLLFVLASICHTECCMALRSLHWKRGLLAVIVASSPWFMWMWVRFGGEFVQGYLLAGNLFYVTMPRSFAVRPASHSLYLWTFLGGFYPWSIVAVGGAIDAIRRWRKHVPVSAEDMVLWAWIFVVIGFFSLARFKVDRYVLPAAPACCLLAARAWIDASNPVRRFSDAASRWAILVLSVSLVVIAVAVGMFMFDLGLGLPLAALLMPTSLAVGGVILTATMLRRRWLAPTSLATPIIMLLVVYGTIVMVGFPVLERVRPTARVARALRAELHDEDQIGLYRLERWRASLRYYLMRPVVRLDQRQEVEEFLRHTPSGYLVLRRRDYLDLQRSGAHLRMVFAQPAVVGTEGRGFRRQQWGMLVVAQSEP